MEIKTNLGEKFLADINEINKKIDLVLIGGGGLFYLIKKMLTLQKVAGN